MPVVTVKYWYPVIKDNKVVTKGDGAMFKEYEVDVPYTTETVSLI